MEAFKGIKEVVQRKFQLCIEMTLYSNALCHVLS